MLFDPTNQTMDLLVSRVGSSLLEDGVAVIEAHVEDATCDVIASEVMAMFEDDDASMHHEWYSVGRATRCERQELSVERYPALHAFFDSAILARIVDDFLGQNAIPHRTIYALEDNIGTVLPVQRLHYDKMRHLKTFLYLSDVDAGSGPFVCVRGSQRLTQDRERARRDQRIVPDDLQTRQLPRELERQEEMIVGPRGTVIFFDSDIAHRAEPPRNAKRLSTRSLSFGPERREQWFTASGSVETIDERDGIRLGTA